MSISQKMKDSLCKSIQACDRIELVIALTPPGEKPEVIHIAEFNEYALRHDGKLEFWHNSGWEV